MTRTEWTIPRCAWLIAAPGAVFSGAFGVCLFLMSGSGLLGLAAMLLGLGAAGGLGLASTAFVRRVRTVSFVDDALRSYADGERSGESLRLAGRFGPAAEAWNAVLAEREIAEDTRQRDRALDSTSAGGDSMGLDHVFQALPLGVLVLDEGQTVLRANGAATVMLGKQTEQLEGAPLARIFDDEIARAALQSVASGQVRHASAQISGAESSGTSVIMANARALRREGQAGVTIVTLDDITQQSVARDAQSLFVSHATHELRTPLTNIRLYVEEAIDAGDDDPEVRGRALDVIQAEVRRLERTVTDMLSSSEIEAGTLSLRTGSLQLQPMFEELARDFGPSAENEGVTLRFDLPPKYPVAVADREKLTLALHNLIGNAIKYTPVDGAVDVRVDADEERLLVEVRDTGIGIGEEDRSRVFERFYRSKDERVTQRTGNGLGLCLAREIARLHGGDIELESDLNEGSTFTLTIPIGDRRRAAA